MNYRDRDYEAFFDYELELQEWFESEDFADWFNREVTEPVEVPTEIFLEICNE